MLQIPRSDGLDGARDEVDDLHQRCGVYTKTELVEHVLDLVGWTAQADLAGKRLLEPSAGDGQFLVAAVRRLIASCRAWGRRPTLKLLYPVISAFELHPLEAVKARDNVAKALTDMGLASSVSQKLAARWVKEGDFLLSGSGKYTHIVGNPPYVRWSSIPVNLRVRYEANLDRRTARGDLFLPFLDRGIDLLAKGGRLGFVCSDRWKFMAFAERFRREVLPNVVIEHDESVSPGGAYLRKVDAYASITVFKKVDRISAPTVLKQKGGTTLAEAGYIVKVGPALGCTPAFVVNPAEDEIEQELLAPWIDGTEIGEGEVRWGRRKVITMHTKEGKLRRLEEFPLAMAHMEMFRSRLEARSICKRGAPWYRPIDKVQHSTWLRPKLLIPELAKVPRVALDTSGAIPSHGVYAIFSPDDDLSALHRQLADGGLLAAISHSSPKVKGGYFRCYRRFLDRIVLT